MSIKAVTTPCPRDQLFAAAEKGDGAAQLQLGCSFEKEKESLEGAALWFFLAAKGGSHEAAEHLRSLADRKVVQAQFFLGFLFERGWFPGRLPSPLLGKKYIAMAAKGDFEPAVKYLARRYTPSVPEVRFNFPPSRCSFEYSFSDEFQIRKGPICRVVIEVRPIEQPGERVDNEKNVDFLRYAATLGDLRSQAILSQLLLDLNLPREAYYWALRAAFSDRAETWINLGLCFEEGRGTEIDLVKARQCYEKGAAKNHPEAFYLLATLIYNQERESAMELLAKAERLGSEKAARALANIRRGLI